MRLRHHLTDVESVVPATDRWLAARARRHARVAGCNAAVRVEIVRTAACQDGTTESAIPGRGGLAASERSNPTPTPPVLHLAVPEGVTRGNAEPLVARAVHDMLVVAGEGGEGRPPEVQTLLKRAGASHTLIDLFAGCGGGSIGFAQAGFRTVAAVEIDPDAAGAYVRNTAVEPVVADVRTVQGSALLQDAGLERGELTVLFGCPPCQSFTVLRRGGRTTELDTRRDALPLEYLRLVRELHPRHIAFENVPGMVEGRGRPHFDVLRDGLTDLGYDLMWDVVDAADYGVPQYRRRLLVIGSRVAKPELPDPTHSRDGRDGRRRHRTVRDAIADLPQLESGEESRFDPLHRARRHHTLTLRRLRTVPEGGGRRDLPPDLELSCHRGHNGHYDIYGRMWWNRPAPTLTSGCTNVTRGRFAHPEQDRAITVREAMLLQSFPQWAVLEGGVESMALQVGNAVPPRLAERIGLLIERLEDGVRGTPASPQHEDGTRPVASARPALPPPPSVPRAPNT